MFPSYTFIFLRCLVLALAQSRWNESPEHRALAPRHAGLLPRKPNIPFDSGLRAGASEQGAAKLQASRLDSFSGKFNSKLQASRTNPRLPDFEKIKGELKRSADKLSVELPHGRPAIGAGSRSKQGQAVAAALSVPKGCENYKKIAGKSSRELSRAQKAKQDALIRKAIAEIQAQRKSQQRTKKKTKEAGASNYADSSETKLDRREPIGLGGAGDAKIDEPGDDPRPKARVVYAPGTRILELEHPILEYWILQMGTPQLLAERPERFRSIVRRLAAFYAFFPEEQRYITRRGVGWYIRSIETRNKYFADLQTASICLNYFFEEVPPKQVVSDLQEQYGCDEGEWPPRRPFDEQRRGRNGG